MPRHNIKIIEIHDTINDEKYYFESIKDFTDKTGYTYDKIRRARESGKLLFKRYKVTAYDKDEIFWDYTLTTEKFEFIDQRLLKYSYPNLYEQLKNKQDKVYPNTKNEYEFICENCGKVFSSRPSDLINNGKCLCEECRKHIWSYPERFMYSLFKNAEINFEIHKKFDWSDNKIYDFYISDNKYIIETHGIQHYENMGWVKGRSLSEQQENDKYKYEMAMQHNEDVLKYIIIDSRYSTFDWMKNNVINSDLCKIIDFDKIDWRKISEDTCNDIGKEVVRLWNDGFRRVVDIMSEIHLGKNTVRQSLSKYIKLLNDVKNEEDLANILKGYRKIDVLKDGKIIKSYNNIEECAKNSMEDFGIKFSNSGISSVCYDRSFTHKGFQFKFSDEEILHKKYKKRGKAVIQKDKKGNVIARYSSRTEASLAINGKTNNVSGICSCCNGKLKSYKGYIWENE